MDTDHPSQFSFHSNPGYHPLLFYEKSYHAIQKYANLKKIELNGFLIYVSIHDGVATSLSRSPSGGIIHQPNPKQVLFREFISYLSGELVAEDIHTLKINQPADYYPGFVHEDWLRDLGFVVKYTDTNQYIPIKGHLETKMHLMEKRKLKKLSAFEFKKSGIERVDVVHEFISRCRKDQGLEINISLHKLTDLFMTFPNHYELYEALHQDTLVSAVVAVSPTPNIAYYYLPATHLSHKSASPMVGLMLFMYNDYKKRGFDCFDLGVSSIEGKLQSSLFTFKQRMGAVATERKTFEYNLNESAG